MFIWSLLLTQRLLTLQEMNRYFVVNEHLAATQRNKNRIWGSDELKSDGLG